MKPLRKRMIGALEDIEKAASFIERDFARYAAVIDPDIQRGHDLHVEGLRDAWRIIAEFGNAPEDFEALLQLRRDKPAGFAAIMDLVRRELERKKEARATERAA